MARVFKMTLLYLFCILCIGFLVSINQELPTITSSSSKQETYKGHISTVRNTNTQYGANQPFVLQQVTILLENGKNAGKTIRNDYEANGTTRPVLHNGDNVIVIKSFSSNGYYILSHYRFDRIVYIIVGFLFLIFLIVGKKGFGSILSIAISFAVIIDYIIPQILSGADPVITTGIASCVILFITTYLAHGISKQTTIALFSTFLALGATIFLSFLSVQFAGLTGYPNEEATDLHFATGHLLNVKGLFLAGIIITTLGALNDITITQSVAIFQLAKSKKEMQFRELVKDGFAIGREHTVSLINTLVFAYTGSSLSVLIYFLLSPTNQPYWSLLSNELIAEEIVKTIAGTTGLLLVVPIVTLFSAYIAVRKS